jgi:hypothetical protein
MSDPIRISASGFAEFVTSRNRSRASKLRPFKFRNKGEGAGRSSYYRRALNTIRAYHRAHGDDKILQKEVMEIDLLLAGTLRSLEATKLRQNRMAIEAYRRMYGKRRLVILRNHRLTCKVGSVTVTAQPDLWVEEDGTQVLLKIGLARKGTEFVNVFLFVMHRAAVDSGHRIGARNVVYLDIGSGTERSYDDRLGRYKNLFEVGAREIAETWPTVTLPARGGARAAP